MTSKLTRERIELIANFHRAMTLPPSHDEIEELARTVLATIDSEPVAWIVHARTGDQLTTDGGYVANAEGILGLHSTPLYRHAQQPVVPPMQHWEELCREHPGVSIGDAIIRAAWWNHCRAAMLQELQKSAGASNNCRSNEKVQAVQVQSVTGIKPAPALGSFPKIGEVLTTNSPVITEGYVMVPKEMTDEIGEDIAMQANCCGGIALDIYDAMLAAALQPQNAPQNIPEIIPGWIPVSERMPEIGDIVLTAMGGVVNVGEMECSAANCLFFTSVISGRELPATHWMPLPAAPQEEK
ncbi:TPA: DUF551 domain-containing protein [Klebsiella michiganensis]